jgi:hypothetical protein
MLRMTPMAFSVGNMVAALLALCAHTTVLASVGAHPPQSIAAAVVINSAATTYHPCAVHNSRNACRRSHHHATS